MTEFDFEEELQKCRDRKKENETIVYSVGVGRIIPMPDDSRKIRRTLKKSMEYIKLLDGFVAIHPADIWHTLLLFDTLNNAKSGRNMIRAKGVACGTYIVPVLVESKYLNQAGSRRRKGERSDRRTNS